MLNLWDILFLPSDLGLSPSAKIWRKCTAPLGILRKSTVAFRIIQYIDRSFSFFTTSVLKKTKKICKALDLCFTGWHSVLALLPPVLLSTFLVPFCSPAGGLMPLPCPCSLALPSPMFFFFFFWCVSEATRAGLASACEVCAAGRSQRTTRNAHPLQASDQCDVTHNSPWTTYCTKWEPLAVQTKT